MVTICGRRKIMHTRTCIKCSYIICSILIFKLMDFSLIGCFFPFFLFFLFSGILLEIAINPGYDDARHARLISGTQDPVARQEWV